MNPLTSRWIVDKPATTCHREYIEIVIKNTKSSIILRGFQADIKAFRARETGQLHGLAMKALNGFRCAMFFCFAIIIPRVTVRINNRD
jgi:hypothetical protein